MTHRPVKSGSGGGEPIRIGGVSGGTLVGAGAEGVVGQEVTVHGNVITVHLHTAEAAAEFRQILALKVDAAEPAGTPPPVVPGPAAERRLDAILSWTRAAQEAGVKTPEVQVEGVRLSPADLLLRKAVLLEAQAEEAMVQTLRAHADEILRMKERAGLFASIDLARIIHGLDGTGDRRLEEARRFAEAAQRLEPDDPNVAYRLALICRSLDDVPEYLRLLRRVIELADPPRDAMDDVRRSTAEALLSGSSLAEAMPNLHLSARVRQAAMDLGILPGFGLPRPALPGG